MQFGLGPAANRKPLAAAWSNMEDVKGCHIGDDHEMPSHSEQPQRNDSLAAEVFEQSGHPPAHITHPRFLESELASFTSKMSEMRTKTK